MKWSYFLWIGLIGANAALGTGTALLFNRVKKDESQIAEDRALILRSSEEAQASIDNQTDHQWNAIQKSSNSIIDTAQKLVDNEHDYTDKMLTFLQGQIADAKRIAEAAKKESDQTSFAVLQANQMNSAQLSSTLAQVTSAANDAAQAVRDAKTAVPISPMVLTPPQPSSFTVTPLGSSGTYVIDPY